MFKSLKLFAVGVMATGTGMFVGCEPEGGVNGTGTLTGPNSTAVDTNSANKTPSTGTMDASSGRSGTGNMPGATGTANTTAGTTANATQAPATQARATLVAIGNSGVAGEINFAQSGGKVKITGTVTGLTPGEHGFHVHEKGDLSDTEKGESVGGHFNPDMKDHGRPSDTTRHAGDFGNITANDQGVAEINVEDAVVKMDGANSIVGRSIVIHAQADRFTQPSGDAGGRVAFGKIESK